MGEGREGGVGEGSEGVEEVRVRGVLEKGEQMANRTYRSWMAFDPSPIVDQPNDDKHDYHEHFYHREPVF